MLKTDYASSEVCFNVSVCSEVECNCLQGIFPDFGRYGILTAGLLLMTSMGLKGIYQAKNGAVMKEKLS